MYAITIVFLASYAAAEQQKGENADLRIHGGVDDNTGKYPYVVALKATFPLKLCTGSFIKDTWVLSAAHCLVPTVKYVQYGNMSKPLAATEPKSVVLKMIRHPGYLRLHDFLYIHSDIGLIMVQQVISMSKYARISAVDYKTLLGQPVEYAGFGKTYLETRDTHNQIQTFLLDIYRPLQIGEGVVTTCEAISRKDVICVGPKCSHNKQMILPGDSGGPLMFDNKIVGVAFAIDTDRFMQSFTPVSPYILWIHSVITSDRPLPIPQNASGASDQFNKL